jgi:hypothetical protein
MRKAAVYLATLHPKDRRWLLAQLPASRMSALDALIAEAEPLVKAAPELVVELLADNEAGKPAEVPAPNLLISTLNTLDESWAARMIAATAPDHAEIYLAACFRQRAMGIRSELGALPAAFPPALARCMADELAVMAHESEATAA